MKQTKTIPFALATLTVVLSSLVVRVFHTPIATDSIIGKTAQETSFFAGAKAIIAVSLALVCLPWLVTHIKEWPNKLLKFLFLGLAITTCIGSSLSPEPGLSLYGYPRHFEGWAVCLSYLIFSATMVVSRFSIPMLKAFYLVILAVTLVVTAIGYGEYFGHNIFNSYGLARLVYGDAASLFIHDRQWKPAGTISSTLMHGNFVGSFLSLATPFLLIAKPYGNRWDIFGKALLALVLSSFAYLTESRAGWIGLSAAILFSLAYSRQKHHWVWVGSLVAGFLIGPQLKDSETLAKKSEKAASIIKVLALEGPVKYHPRYRPFREVKVNGAEARIHFRDTFLQVTAIGDQLVFSDETGFPMEVLDFQDRLILQDSRYQDWLMLKRRWQNQQLIILKIEHFVIPLTVSPNQLNIWAFKSPQSTAIPPTLWEPTLVDHLFSARPYIWNRTLPLIGDSLWWGYGPGRFALLFPQNDFLGKLNAYARMDIIADKPHNIYLQQWFQFGILNLICFVALPIFLTIRKGLENFTLALAAGVVGYLVSGLANDSVVAVAPTYWVFLGILASITFQPKQKAT